MNLIKINQYKGVNFDILAQQQPIYISACADEFCFSSVKNVV